MREYVDVLIAGELRYPKLYSLFGQRNFISTLFADRVKIAEVQIDLHNLYRLIVLEFDP